VIIVIVGDSLLLQLLKFLHRTDHLKVDYVVLVQPAHKEAQRPAGTEAAKCAGTQATRLTAHLLFPTEVEGLARPLGQAPRPPA
jgi:hypothetical protein